MSIRFVQLAPSMTKSKHKNVLDIMSTIFVYFTKINGLRVFR
jgi:hypothetical protein